jgi:hypothetical protein
MHHIALHIMHCIMLFLAHLCSYTLDHAEPKLEVQAEQAQAEDLTNLALDQGKPGASHQYSLAFLLITTFMLSLTTH